MDDSKIIELYWLRDQEAITQIDMKYGRLCRGISLNIVSDPRDSEECVADTYMAAWNSMPPQRPLRLKAWLAAVVRKLSLMRLRSSYAKKKGGGAVDLVFEELGDTFASSFSVEEEYEATGVENILELEGYEEERVSFIAYNDGSFCLQNHISLGSDRGSIDTALWRSVKGYFAQGNLEFDPDRQLQERVYTTAQGLDILIVDDAASSAALFYDGPAAFVAMGLDYFDEPMTGESLEQIAEGINFLGLGAESQVDEQARQPRPTPPPPTGGEMQERRDNMAAGTVDLGESFRGNPYSPANSKLEICVEELSLSENIYAAVWEPEQFLDYSVVSMEENGSWESISCPDYFDRDSGELTDGVQLLTVKIRVSNRSEGDIDPGMGANLFANCQLHLINAGKTIRGEDGSYTDNIAYSGPWGGGQYSLVELAPGETLSYCLGYAIDDAFPLEEAWLSTVPQGIPGTYIPLGTAELK